jgi:hypothetical protein
MLAGFLEMYLWGFTTQCLTLVIFSWVLLRLLRVRICRVLAAVIILPRNLHVS